MTHHTSSSSSHGQESSSPRPSSISLAAAATMNAADISHRSSISNNRVSPNLDRLSTERRRSQVAANLSLNDPSLPSPGELSSSDPRRLSFGQSPASHTTASPSTLGGRGTIATGDPHHVFHNNRPPSLGDIHNQMEQEQEAHVNHLLSLLRDQQQILDNLRNQQQNQSALNTTAIVDDITPASDRSITFPSPHPALQPHALPIRTHRHASRGPTTPTAHRSPALRPLPALTHEPSSTTSNSSTNTFEPLDNTLSRRSSHSTTAARDDSAYYIAETASLTRENQMLRLRIRELEKQLAEDSESPANTPSVPSNLATSPVIRARESETDQVETLAEEKI